MVDGGGMEPTHVLYGIVLVLLFGWCVGCLIMLVGVERSRVIATSERRRRTLPKEAFAPSTHSSLSTGT